MVHDTPLSQGASTHQIWNSLLKEYKIYAPDTIILKTRSEVKVTVTQKWHVTPGHPKMHLHTKFGIPISKNIGDMHQTQCSFQETRSEVKFKVTVTQLWYGTHQIWKPYLKEYRRYGPDTKAGRTDGRTDGLTDGQCDYYMSPKVPLGA